MVGARRAARPSLRRSRAFPVTVVLVLIAAATTLLGAAAPAAAALPKGFTVVTALSGLTQPTAVRFAPNGRVFVAEKRGTIQMFDDLADTTPTQVADLRTDVNNVSDRGLLGLAVDPGFPDRPYLYALYTFDGPMGGASPLWGVAGQDNDPCPDAPAATSPGCVVSGKLTRLTLTGDSTTGQDLIHDWCQQYVTHTVGDVVFGADGALYVSGGDGASWGGVDYGQGGLPPNPCGDPPGEAGTAPTPPSAEGGALRAQDLRTTGGPGVVGRHGRPRLAGHRPGPPRQPERRRGGCEHAADRGLRAAQPLPHHDAPGHRRALARGGRVALLRRRSTASAILAPAGPELRLALLRGHQPTGGVRRASAWRSAPVCTASGRDDQALVQLSLEAVPLSGRDDCSTGPRSSISGIAFRSSAGSAYPASYDGALFFSDFSRNCIWIMRAGVDGLPDPSTVRSFVSDAAGPVDLQVSPPGELCYVDLVGGTVRRIVYGSAPA